MISDPMYNVFTSLLIKKENSTNTSDKIQIMMFLNEIELKIFELARINKISSNNVNYENNLNLIIFIHSTNT